MGKAIKQSRNGITPRCCDIPDIKHGIYDDAIWDALNALPDNAEITFRKEDIGIKIIVGSDDYRDVNSHIYVWLICDSEVNNFKKNAITPTRLLAYRVAKSTKMVLGKISDSPCTYYDRDKEATAHG